LFAEHYDLKHPEPHPGEMEFLLRRVEDGGEPVLELGCGTGRMLIPLLEAGIDASGVDVSPDMLDRCRARCVEKDLHPGLYLQGMQTLDLPRKFGTVSIHSASLGVLNSEDDLAATFNGVYELLKSKGVVAFEFQTPPEPRSIMDRAGVWSGGWDAADDGSVIVYRQIFEYDPGTHMRPSVIAFERYVDDRLAETELYEGTMRFWEIETITLHMQAAGFIDMITTNVFADDEPPGDNQWLVVRARKP
jgi:SAM-dependent methyltransferase